MTRHRVNQHLIVLNLDSISINKILVTEFITVKVSTQRNQQLSRYVFSKVIEYFEQNIRKQIHSKRLLNTKRMNRVRNIPIEI